MFTRFFSGFRFTKLQKHCSKKSLESRLASHRTNRHHALKTKETLMFGYGLIGTLIVIALIVWIVRNV
jgi:hypothetical protein